MKSKRGYSTAQYLPVGQDQLVVVSLWHLEQDGRVGTFENLVEEAFESFPARFALEGHPHWPNSQIVQKAWWRGRSDRKWIAGSAPRGLKLTPRGRQVALETLSQIMQTPSGEASRRGSRQTVASRVVLRIERGAPYRKKQTVVRVIDHAEGMDDVQLEKAVGGYGEDTSGHIGRGVFGMGLKDTINAFGEGTITSFKNGQKYVCVLKNAEDLEIHPAELVSVEDLKTFRNTTGGTTVEIEVSNPDVRIPQVDSLRQQLQTHVCLRGIMTDPRRTLSLRDLKSGIVDEMKYDIPDSEALVEDKRLFLPSYPSTEATLTLRRATGHEALGQTGSYRTGGVLIVSKRTYHESTLFGFDDDPYADRLLGELRCDEIYDMQYAGQPIVDKNRDGLRKTHPLTKELFDAARKIVEGVVVTEKERQKESQKHLEHEGTVRRFRDAIKSLNEMARTELRLAPGGMGQGSSRDSAPPGGCEPEKYDALKFIPETYRLLVAERAKLKLRVMVDGRSGISVGRKVMVSCDNKHIKVLDTAPVIPRLEKGVDPPHTYVYIEAEGLQANAQGLITARCGANSAIALVEVVSTRVQKEAHAPVGSGMFNAIRYAEWPETPVRARFDASDGAIVINAAGPSVDLYFGKGGEGQDDPVNQVLVAELVTELAAQLVARKKRDAKLLDIPPGVDELEAVASQIARLKADYAPLIHRALVAPENRRK